MRLRRSLITGILALLTTGAAMAQPSAPAAPAAAPAKAIPLDEAARQLIDVCTDHALGTAPIYAAWYRLQRIGFELSDFPGVSRTDRIYHVEAPTAAGLIRVTAEPNGQCIIMSGSVPRAAFDAAFSRVFVSSTDYKRTSPMMGWRWQKVLASVSELPTNETMGMVRIRPFYKE